MLVQVPPERNAASYQTQSGGKPGFLSLYAAAWPYFCDQATPLSYTLRFGPLPIPLSFFFWSITASQTETTTLQPSLPASMAAIIAGSIFQPSAFHCRIKASFNSANHPVLEQSVCVLRSLPNRGLHSNTFRFQLPTVLLEPWPAHSHFCVLNLCTISVTLVPCEILTRAINIFLIKLQMWKVVNTTY